jgi:elongation factor Tu
MSQEKEIYSLGIVGHVDHGKTSFTSAATVALESYGKPYGVTAKAYDQIDKAPEERDRGITIKQTTLELYSPKRHYIVVDCPGHQDYIRNMIAGTFQVDSIILLVAANALVQEQTKEHLRLVSKIIITEENKRKKEKLKINLFINKMDLLDNDDEENRQFAIDAILVEVKDFCDDNDLELAVVGKGSVQRALHGKSQEEKERELENIRSFFSDLDAQLPSPVRDIDKPFQMFIDNVYSIAGRGTVVSGCAKRGILEVGQEVQIVRMGRSNKELIKKTIASDLEEFQKKTKRISAGANFGCLLRGIDKNEVETGDMLTAVMPVHFYTKFRVIMALMSEREQGRKSPIHVNYQPSFFVGTSAHTGTILEMKKGEEILKEANPGEMNIDAIISFAHPIYLQANTTIVFREGGKTVGYAQVLSGVDDSDIMSGSSRSNK